MMPFHRTAAIVLRQFYLMRGSPVRVLPVFAWVAGRHRAVGIHHKISQHDRLARFDFVPMLLGAILLWDFFTRVMHG